VSATDIAVRGRRGVFCETNIAAVIGRRVVKSIIAIRVYYAYRVTRTTRILRVSRVSRASDYLVCLEK
jgi:hypothetical protein